MKYYALIVLIMATGMLTGCGGDGQPDVQERPVDSQMVAEHVDPSTKFPQQVVVDTTAANKNFVDDALGRTEETISLAELALQQGANATVKQVAQVIADDQHAMHRRLLELAKDEKRPDTGRRFSDGSYEELKNLAGAAFDRQWVEKMVTRNAADISRFAAESDAAKNKGVRKFADEALPKLKAHQQQLESCRVKLQ
ncbi:DUF4142 domain-containing protein [Paraflavitalea sp. CAU 1676]|uniref:DUF4142 domain-containing protein n=1 Tax=Paraflavitalea sp. CAU 1676 TaxID=3032598 RepID=UPI0023DB99BC|nr:DUF4142 domain-containing protein [Paraflavitalea sp. CAU 1676]MDF2190302.1 DUF4142 domain-containing protein [Paraflavitalea sp. CAU 1676]